MLEQDTIQEDASPDATTPTPRARPRVDRMTIGVGLLVAIAAAGVYAMHWRTKDGAALVANAGQSAGTLETLLSDGREGIASLKRAVAATRDMVTRFTGGGPRHDVDAAAQLASASFGSKPRDPFLFELPELPKPATNFQTVNSTSATKAAALADARQLQVQSIIHGSARRACLISGKLYFEGQTVSDFVIHSISRDAVIVRRGEFKFELRLRK